ncbi:hypothetical protein FIBSPDRAFT_868034 [Athelia psychrophila]|uniref:Uncharacterized protein n=1 Tax=Athelia psychrophila TaxID=1759441 RepID=A0A166DEW8_9AGAM|nr:hypothetical protein FIBSPDRAFT_868034 [Fibularhizoctonia sp. CBS 109695]
MLEEDIKVVADFLQRSVQIALMLQKEAGTKLLKDFVAAATKQQEGKQVQDLKKDVQAFATKWPLPGVDVKNLQKPEGLHK